jgi:hypothetical protein
MLPRGRGAPGALGFCDGLKTSEDRPDAGGGEDGDTPCCRMGGGSTAERCIEGCRIDCCIGGNG